MIKMDFKKFMENCMTSSVVETICVISAQNPQGIKLNDQQNKKLKANLRLDLISMACNIKDITGTFDGHSEDAFIVVNISKKDAIDLGIKYGQKSIIWGYRSDEEFVFQYIEQNKVKQKIEIPYREQDVKNSNFLFNSISNGKFSIPYFFIS